MSKEKIKCAGCGNEIVKAIAVFNKAGQRSCRGCVAKEKGKKQ